MHRSTTNIIGGEGIELEFEPGYKEGELGVDSESESVCNELEHPKTVTPLRSPPVENVVSTSRPASLPIVKSVVLVPEQAQKPPSPRGFRRTAITCS